MPIYVYESLNTKEQFEFMQNVNDKAFTQHPETCEPIKRIIVSCLAVKTQVKRSLKVNKKSPAATACGCAKKAHRCHH